MVRPRLLLTTKAVSRSSFALEKLSRMPCLVENLKVSVPHHNYAQGLAMDMDFENFCMTVVPVESPTFEP
jgi:hypothetical protein